MYIRQTREDTQYLQSLTELKVWILIYSSQWTALLHSAEETSMASPIIGKSRSNLQNSAAQPSEMSENLTLKREIGLTSAISLVAGTMIGSGIFMSPEWVLHNIGSPGGSLIIWAACGLVVIFGALSYAELGILIKESGGDYIYILRTFGSLPAFLFAFTSIIVVRPAGVAAISLSFAEYALVPFYSGCSPPQVMIKCTAISCILFLTLVNCLSVRLAMSMMNIFTAAKLLALLVIAVGGLVLLQECLLESMLLSIYRMAKEYQAITWYQVSFISKFLKYSWLSL
uniref:Zmp:0000001267 n=1 Tax=Laticauda laticaudata TaxID=8630 RepID=A0A8C5RP13_LATLA